MPFTRLDAIGGISFHPSQQPYEQGAMISEVSQREKKSRGVKEFAHCHVTRK